MNIQLKRRLLLNLSRALPISFLATALFLAAGPSGQQPVRQNSGERVPLTAKDASQQAPKPLSLNLSGAFREGRNIHNLKPVSAEEIAAADKASAEKFAGVRPGPLRAGLVRSVGAVPLSLKGGHALQPARAGGGKMWTLAIKSPGAFGLRVHFTNFDVGAGSAIVYARYEDSVITRGPYTGKGPDQTGDFWTASLPGDVVFIEVAGSGEPRLEVAEIIHFDKPPGGQDQGKTAAPEEWPCHLDVMCETVDTLARDATVAIGFTPVNNGGAFFCSGTIINDLDGETTVPYLLTAKHCGITPANVSSIEVVYLYQRSSCGGPLPNFMTLPRSIGGTVLESLGANDMTFIRLNGDLPGGASLAGWSTKTSTGSYGIHHPDGSWKRVTFTSSVGFCLTCLCLEPDFFDYYDQDRGIIEPGSSGSGIFDNSGRLVGQLYGYCCFGSCAPYGCGSVDDYWAVYGEFETTYPFIRRWLEIGGTIHVDWRNTETELGTPDNPFRTVTAAYNFAWNGARIKIKTGSYREALTMSKQVTILADGGPVIIGP